MFEIDPTHNPTTVRRPALNEQHTQRDVCSNRSGTYTGTLSDPTANGVGESIFSGFTHKSQSPPPDKFGLGDSCAVHGSV